MKAFTVNASDLLDKSKNPNLLLSVEDVLNNPKIRKAPIAPPIPKVTVSNMVSSSGNRVANQFKICTEDATYFQSYGSLIACRMRGQVYLDRGTWDYSTTTGKYRNIFLGETKAETQKKIDSGECILTDLNK